MELCAGIATGGVTPSHGLIRSVCSRLRIPVHVLVRPRPGGFLYSPDERAVMRDDILAARELGAAGVVLGVLTPRGTVDAAAMGELIRVARPMNVTFHRAFDEVASRWVGGGAGRGIGARIGRGAGRNAETVARRMHSALGTLVDLGVDRLLTTGGPLTAFAGRRQLRDLVTLADGRITVMAGGGITPAGVRRIIRETGVTEVHVGSAVSAFRTGGSGAFSANVGAVDATKVKAFVKLLRTPG